MIQKLVFILGLVFGSQVFAMPQVGDVAYYNKQYVVTLEGQANFQTALEMVTLTEYDSATKIFSKETQEISPMGHLSKVVEKISSDDIMNDESIKVLLEKCVGGVKEEIMVAKVKMPACRLPTKTGSFIGFQWIARVPFGLAKSSVSFGDSAFNINLTSFHTK